MKKEEPPNAFISHASEDKERFVTRFAKKLRENGIDAWYDQWEIKPGDSLVNKIFEQGLKPADIVIVVLSAVSVKKPWVNIELEAAIVKQVVDGHKIIPVVIDKCEIPMALRSLLYVEIKNLDDCDAELRRIVDAIYGHSEKPPLGSPPSYIHHNDRLIPGLEIVDEAVLKLACEKLIAQHSELGSFQFGTNGMLKDAAAIGIDAEQLFEAMEMLEQQGFVESVTQHGNKILVFRVTEYGFGEYGRAYIAGYNEMIRKVGVRIYNHNEVLLSEIMQSLESTRLIVRHALEVLKHRGLINYAEFMGNDGKVTKYGVELKRFLQKGPLRA